MITSPVIDVHAQAEFGKATLPCSTTLGCELTFPGGERLTNVIIGDQRYSVNIASDGTDSPAHLIIYPPRDIRRVPEAKLNITDSARTYAVVISPTHAATTNRLAFYARPALPTRFVLLPDVVVPTPEPGETLAIDPTQTIASWRFSGDAYLACSSLFEYQAQVWCRLPRTLIDAPSVYTISGRSRGPVNSRIVNRSWLVIASLDGPFELHTVGGGIEHVGKLEHTHE